MAYTVPTAEAVAGIEAMTLSPDQRATLIDFIETTLGEDGEVETCPYDASDQAAPLPVDATTEQADLRGGGAYVLPGGDMLVIVQTDEGPVVTGGPAQGRQVMLVGGGGGEMVDLSDGAGSAVVYARGGDDTIIATDGADELSGGEGDDLIRAGAGDDTVEGDAGSDTIEGGAGFDQIVFHDLSRADAEITIEGSQVSILDTRNGDTDLVTGIEYVSFAGGDPAVFVADDAQGDIVRLFEVVLDRTPGPAGVDFWLDKAAEGYGIVRIAQVFLRSDEFVQSVDDPLSDEDFVFELFSRAFEREPGQPGIDFWIERLETSPDSPEIARSQVAASFATAPETDLLHDYIQVLPDLDLG